MEKIFIKLTKIKFKIWRFTLLKMFFTIKFFFWDGLRVFAQRTISQVRTEMRHSLGSLLVLSAHSFASNWQLPFLNQRKGENGRIIFFMTKSPRNNVRRTRGSTRDSSHTDGRAFDRAIAPGYLWCNSQNAMWYEYDCKYYFEVGSGDGSGQLSVTGWSRKRTLNASRWKIGLHSNARVLFLLSSASQERRVKLTTILFAGLFNFESTKHHFVYFMNSSFSLS